MANTSEPLADKQLIAYERFDQRLRTHLKSLINDAMIEEHRRRPLGQHSDDLDRVLNYFRRPPKYGLYSPKPMREYRLISFPVTPGDPPRPIDDTVYHDKNEALHAVFMRHLADLQAE
jgi:branched-chain amino acid transport system permease protein